ncbi:hypothetical protein D1871_11215 [Nakamurella silvestris]|nr:hypothetical protein D1871_11215 [Nakamurella silvestris]
MLDVALDLSWSVFSISWVDWIGVFALGLALFGAIKARKQVSEVTLAIEKTERRMNAFTARSLIEAMRRGQHSLMIAVDQNSHSLAYMTLDEWRWTVNQLSTLPKLADLLTPELKEALGRSVALATVAMRQLSNKPGNDVRTSVKRAKAEVEMAVGEVTKTLSLFTGTTEGGVS